MDDLGLLSGRTLTTLLVVFAVLAAACSSSESATVDFVPVEAVERTTTVTSLISPLATDEPAECSGSAVLAGEPDLMDLPAPVAEMVIVIDQVAQTCDWATLNTLIGEDFEWGLVQQVVYRREEGIKNADGEVTDAWQAAEAEGATPMLDLRRLLRAEFGTIGDDLVWPSIRTRSGCDSVTDQEWQWWAEWTDVLADELQQDCAKFLGGDPEALPYWGLRTAFDDSGTWLYLVDGIIS